MPFNSFHAEAAQRYTCRFQVLKDIAQLDRERREMTSAARREEFLLNEFEYRCLRPERRCQEVLALCQLFFLLPIPEPDSRTHVTLPASTFNAIFCDVPVGVALFVLSCNDGYVFVQHRPSRTH